MHETESGVRVNIEGLTRWADTRKGASSSSVQSKNRGPPPRFPIAPEINQKIILWKGDICSLEGVDAVVNSTNEAMTERNDISKRIFAAAGKELQVAVSKLEGCKTGEARITDGFNLPTKYVIHTVGPRYNEKYQIAAENALHNCYRNCLQLLVEHGGQSIVFSVVNSEKRGYPPENGAHIAIRTVRRFLERYGQPISTVVFCMDNERDYNLYERILWMYCPRNKEEEREAVAKLPEDTGNELGETVVEERMIRISSAPAGDETVVDDGHLFRSLTEMKEHPDKTRQNQKKTSGEHRILYTLLTPMWIYGGRTAFVRTK